MRNLSYVHEGGQSHFAAPDFNPGAQGQPAMSKASRSLRHMSKQTIRKIMSDIRRVLWEQWDPIGVNDNPRAFGEYDGYSNSLYNLLMGGASDDELAQRLQQHETVDMGLPRRTNEQRMTAVRALRAIDLDPPDAP